MILQSTFCHAHARTGLHSCGLDSHNRVMLCNSMTGILADTKRELKRLLAPEDGGAPPATVDALWQRWIALTP